MQIERYSTQAARGSCYLQPCLGPPPPARSLPQVLEELAGVIKELWNVGKRAIDEISAVWEQEMEKARVKEEEEGGKEEKEEK